MNDDIRWVADPHREGPIWGLMLSGTIATITLATCYISVCGLVTDHIRVGGYAITSVHPSVDLFPLYLPNPLTVDLERLRVSRSLP